MIIWLGQRLSWNFADIFSTDRAGLWSLCGLVLRRRACWAARLYQSSWSELGAHRFNMNVDLARQLIGEMFAE